MYGLSALGNRRGRWRTSEGLIPWKSRGGSKELNDFLRSTISQESLDRNSNEGGRTLTPEEAKHAEAISKGKKDQKAKSRGRKPASTPSSTEKGVSVSTEPQSSPGQTLPNGYPDPSSPSLVRHPRPLSTLLVGIERAQEENRQREEERAREEERVREEEKFENPLANGGIHASNTFEHSLDASQDDQNPFQPSGTMDWGAGTSGAFFDNNVPGFGPITYGDAQGHDYQGWDEVQEQLWASLSNEIWDFTGSNTVGPTGGIGQDGGDNIPINQNGHHEWSQPGHSDAVQDATQTQHQIHQIQQQRQGVFDQVDNHAGQNGSPAQLDWSTSQMIDQQRSANSVGNLQSQLNHTNQFVPPTQRVVAGTDLQQTADSGSTILQNSYCPVSNGDKHKRTADPKAATEFAARQTAKDDFRGRVEQAPQSATKANDLGLPPLIDLTGDSPELEAHRHPDFRTAMSNSQQLVEADEQAMRILQNTAPTSSYPTGHPTTDSSHPVSASTSLPVHDGIANQPSSPPTTTIPFSSPPTPTITPIEASLIPPTTRLHHAILWRLFKPTREAFKAAFRDDEWRPYVARNFVPTNTEPMSYMDMLDYYSGEFWKVWTARYGFQVEVPRLAGPTVIDEGVARALGDGGEGGGM